MARSADPKSIRINHHTPRDLVGESRCGGVKVRIYKNGDPLMTRDFDGNTQWYRGVMEVDLSARLFEKGQEKRLARVLLHEFAHVVEYCNSHEFLSPVVTVDNCSEMAQAMEEGLGDLYEHLQGHPKLTSPARRPRKARK